MATLSRKLKDEAKRVHARLVEVKRQENTATAELAFLLADVKDRRLYRAFTRTSVGDYAVHYGFTHSTSKANDLVRLVEDLKAAPGLREDFAKGDLDWTKVRTGAAAVRAGGDPEVWRKRVREHTYDVLQTMAAEERGEPKPVRWMVKLSKEDEADVEGALAQVRTLYGRGLDDGQALAILCRAWRTTQAGGGGAGVSSTNPANRIVTSRCGDCERAWRETRSGRVAVSPERLEAAACDAERSDVRNGPGRITRSVPPKIRRHVLDRAGHRCSVPGCSSVGYLHVHHEPGREATGHDPDTMTPLCDAHHGQRHDGLLELRPEGKGTFRYFRADGTEITGAVGDVAATPGGSYERVAEPQAPSSGTELAGAVGDVAATPGGSYERVAEPQPPTSDGSASTSPGSREPGGEGPELNHAARRGLARLGLRAREAAEAVSRAREVLVERCEPITIESLLREALAS